MSGGRPRTWVTWGGRAGRTEDQGSRRESGCVGGNPVRAQAASWVGWGPGSCDAGSGQGRALALLGGEGQGAAATAQEPCPGGDSRANTGEPGGGGVSTGVTAPGWGRQPWVSAPNPQAWLWLPPRGAAPSTPLPQRPQGPLGSRAEEPCGGGGARTGSPPPAAPSAPHEREGRLSGIPGSAASPGGCQGPDADACSGSARSPVPRLAQ